MSQTDKLPKWFLALHFAAKKTDPLSALEKNSDLDLTLKDMWIQIILLKKIRIQMILSLKPGAVILALAISEFYTYL